MPIDKVHSTREEAKGQSTNQTDQTHTDRLPTMPRPQQPSGGGAGSKRYFDAPPTTSSTSKPTSKPTPSQSQPQRPPLTPAERAAKREAALAERAANPTMLFVSSLPFSATSTDLETLFSDVGPLRKAFVVTDSASGSHGPGAGGAAGGKVRSKGVGYVQFAQPEDARRAVAELHGKRQGIFDGSRAIQVQFADQSRKRDTRRGAQNGKREGEGGEGQEQEERASKRARPSPYERPSASACTSTTPTPTTSATPHLHPSRAQAHAQPPQEPQESQASAFSSALDSARTLVLYGLAKCAPAADARALQKRARKAGEVDRVVYPVPIPPLTSAGEEQEGESSGTSKSKKKPSSSSEEEQAQQFDADIAHVLFRTPNHAQLALPKLDAHVFKGSVLRAVLKKQADGMARLESSLKRTEHVERREAAIAQIERESTSAIDLLFPPRPDELSGEGGKGGAGKMSAKQKHLHDERAKRRVDGRLALNKAGGGLFATGKMDRRSRLIVRNLPFDVSVDLAHCALLRRRAENPEAGRALGDWFCSHTLP